MNVSATFFVKANFILQITKQRSYLEKKSFFFNFIAIPKKKFFSKFYSFSPFSLDSNKMSASKVSYAAIASKSNLNFKNFKYPRGLRLFILIYYLRCC
jgi:hypothetical protein